MLIDDSKERLRNDDGRESGEEYAALLRLARFQAESCETNMRTFVRNVRAALKRPALVETEVPAGLVRDVALPRFKR